VEAVLEKYEVVIGLEIHAQMLTKTKAFSSDRSEYGALPNHNISAITLGHPGTLPRHNKKAVENAIKVGLAFDCSITEENIYARKNYFYADLPKGYQITQDKTPLCVGGFVKIKEEDGTIKKIELTRIHMEEDSGKSIHDMDVYDSLIDYNRAGTPLVEIVTEPVIKTGEEAYKFVTEVRKILRYLEVCDGNMEEGSLRCDANISIMPKGTKTFGTKVEVKNMNSITNVKKAIEYEIIRQAVALDKGETIVGETRSYDAVRNVTFSMRAKELVNDYRYFPEPDLPPLIVTKEKIAEIKATMPLLPEQLEVRFKNEFGLNEYDAHQLTENKELAAYFEEVSKHTQNYKAAANWIMGDIKGYLNANALELVDFSLSGESIAQIIALIDSDQVSNSMASQKLFPALVQNPTKSPLELANELNIVQNSDVDFLETVIDEVLAEWTDKVDEYKSGKKGLMGLFVGEVMKRSQGKADPKATSALLGKKLDS
jgi:aspartyl-tRNA(Asn)/glutamyl-tRNA(Gln) amidotransferase subunit B